MEEPDSDGVDYALPEPLTRDEWQWFFAKCEDLLKATKTGVRDDEVRALSCEIFGSGADGRPNRFNAGLVDSRSQGRTAENSQLQCIGRYLVWLAFDRRGEKQRLRPKLNGGFTGIEMPAIDNVLDARELLQSHVERLRKLVEERFAVPQEGVEKAGTAELAKPYDAASVAGMQLPPYREFQRSRIDCFARNELLLQWDEERERQAENGGEPLKRSSRRNLRGLSARLRDLTGETLKPESVRDALKSAEKNRADGLEPGMTVRVRDSKEYELQTLESVEQFRNRFSKK